MNRRRTRLISGCLSFVCGLAVLFALSTSSRSAEAKTRSNAEDAVRSADMPEIAENPPASLSGRVVVSPAKLTYPLRAVGTKSEAQTVTLTNHLSTTLRVSPPEATGDFTVVKDTCGSVVAAGKNCIVAVVFSPKREGIRTGALRLSYHASGGPAVVALRGAASAATLTSITVTPTDSSIVAGTTEQFTATGTYSDGTTKNITGSATWSSSSTTVATISNASGSQGLATAKAAGTTKITATFDISSSNTVSQTTTLTVTAPVLKSIAITPVNPSIPVGKTPQFSAAGTYNNGSTQNLTAAVTWSSSSTGVATISNAAGSQGLAQTATVGVTTITAVSGTVKGTTTLTVTAGFLLTGSLNDARDYHTATLLNNGQVLVAGGAGANNNLVAGGELYDPGSGAFSLTGSLNTPRFIHTATLLDNGTVLIAGGLGTVTSLASAELYNPSTGGFTTTGSMSVARSYHTATLLNNGMVLIAGGQGADGSPVALAELYNPVTGTFTPTGSLNTARFSHTATLLDNGMVLIVGGVGPTNTLASVELYNPATGTFTLTGSLSAARYYHTATLLDNGEVLVAGGGNFNADSVFVYLFNVELYNPASGTFTAGGNLLNGRTLHTATLLDDGMVLIAGGTESGNILTSAELYNPATQTSTLTGSLNDAREIQTATLLDNGDVLIAGGFISTGAIASAELYMPPSLTPPGLASIAVTPTSPNVPLGTPVHFTALGTSSGGSSEQLAAVTWSSSNPSVLSIGSDAGNSGGGSAVGEGSATVSACAGSICGSTTVTVSSGLLSLAVTPANSVVAPGTSVQLYAVGTLSNGNTQDFTSSVNWSSSAPAVATVGANGLASTLIAGSTTITATLGAVQASTTLTAITPPTLTGNLVDPRTYHTATMLNNGLVLIVGGYNTNGPLASAELYNPATGTFALTGSLNTARWLHTATLLNNGMVLIAGGYNASNGGFLASAELYNPSTGTFSYTASPLNTAREWHTATLLQNGMVLLAGGYGTNGFLDAAEIFDPTNQTFMPTGNMNSTRASHTATLLNDGTVLIAGGNDGYGYFNVAEIFHPGTGSFSYTTTGLITARSLHTATLLNDGQVLITGGFGAGGFVATAELYNVFTGMFTPAGSLNTARDAHTATLLTNGNVLVAGGESLNGYLASTEVFNLATSSYTLAGNLPNALGSATATQLGNGQVLIAGGFGADGYFNAASLYSPDTLTPPGLVSIDVTDALPMFSPAQLAPGENQQYYAIGTFSDGSTAQLASVVWSSGTTQDVVISNDASNAGSALTVGSATAGTHVVISATAGSVSGVTAATLRPAGFVNASLLYNGTKRDFHTATLLNNGLVLIAGGKTTGGTPLATAELYNPATNTFVSTGSMSMARYYHTATLLQNGTVLITGGFYTAGKNPDPTNEAEVYTPSTGTFTVVSSMEYARAGHTATLLTNGEVLIAGGVLDSQGDLNPLTELYYPPDPSFSSAGDMRAPVVYGAATLLYNGQVLITGGLEAADNGTTATVPSNLGQIYDPVSGSWFLTTGNLNTARSEHTATLLPNGQVLIAGGYVASPSGPTTSAELYNPATQTFLVTGSMNSARELQTATLLNSGLVLMAGGTFVSPETEELYNPATATFTTTGSSLSTAIAAHTATLLNNGMVLLTGGENPGLAVLSVSELY